ncbi:putative alpha-1,2-mannosidase [Dysgonomonas hofstadii]|uniref:Putative alpha-1,2-mannosidase n=1 Tax=Dysgonomonas hofstadii TaxID=637886 RepID=A0A840CGW4_9BACT|nr:glycoside hydrolase domain-containing protein [Dysgonomonas hofstadii]MBB4034476.1 putative alpha-1,2-mannosidase [Dysgonomonas hofstadii]
MRKSNLYFAVAIIFLIFSNFSIVSAQKNSEYVKIFIGTAGDNGQVDPAACVPYGMARVCPDSDPRSHAGYDYDITKISGFSVNRISGIGCSGAGGNISIKPSLKETELYLDKNYEMAMPGYYITSLDNGVKAEFTATNNVAFEQYHYPIWKEALMSINFAASFTKVLDVKYEIVSDSEIQGYIQAGNTCDHGAYKLYFNLTTSRPFTVKSRTEREAELSFGSEGLKPVEVRVALSPINTETAKKENEKVKKLTFEQVKKQAADEWENILSRIELKGASEEDKIMFYTSLYRVFLSPANVTSLDGKFLGTDGGIYPIEDFTYYSSWSMWDTYRTKFPLITLLDSKNMRNFANSLCNLYAYGKKDWATKFESTPTVRTEHSIAVILDAYKKGITNINLTKAYEGMKKEMDNLPASRPDQALESCIDWWSMAQIAGILNKNEDAEKYSQKAKNTFIETWNKDFKNVDSTFSQMKDNGLYQGTRWQYRWALPQYLDYMTESLGKETLTSQLDYYFANNLFNQSNEVGLHAPYIFNRLGKYENSQKNIRRIIKEDLVHRYGGNAEYPKPYVGKPFRMATEGFMPEMDEDDGTMGAWYVFSTLGLYPLIVGESWYEITSPFFDNITIKLDNGKKINIKTKNRKSPDDVIKKVTFNKAPVSDFRIDHNELIKGGTLELEY